MFRDRLAFGAGEQITREANGCAVNHYVKTYR